MDVSRWLRMRPLLDRALELSGEDRARYLESACSEDPDLRAELDDILAADAAEGGVLRGSTGAFVDDVCRELVARATLTGETALAGLEIESVVQGALRKLRPGRPATNDISETHGRFLPGTVIANRYRIVARLGRGGMGDVYRADDLKIGQAVALKFLAATFEREPRFLDRLLSEVRVARQVAHPNVCRVYDVGEAEGRHFLTMEYVDGEDLGSLLRRIGRLPREKALDIARQLCAGLGAAHELGIVHRDVKPANVMLDGRGRVHIADFGLAAAADELRDQGAREGTTAYMAPEQLDGREVSVRSDVYALGLVLYELFTGKRAFAAASADALRSLQRISTPARPSTVVENLDPAVDRAILTCLAEEPSARPASAKAVAARLPGGEPLDAALAAGETPSPEMVAAAGEPGTLAPRTAWLLLVAVLGGIAATIQLSSHTHLANLLPAGPSPEVLEARAQEVLHELGHVNPPGDSEWHSDDDPGFLSEVVAHRPAGEAFRDLALAEPGPLRFVYRQSPRLLTPRNLQGRVFRDDPPLVYAGEAQLILDTRGRLLRLGIVPPQYDVSSPSDVPPNWDVLFSAAGLARESFEPVSPRWTPETGYDTRAAWEGAYGGRTVRVEAAAFQGQPVFFRIIAPWEQPERDKFDPRTAFDAFLVALASSVAPLTLVVLALLARRNLRLGRGDRKGALRLGAAAFVSEGLSLVLQRHWVPDSDYLRVGAFFVGVGVALLAAFAAWVYYLGSEPYLRRRWPHMLIAWTRLLEGGWRNPLVGRAALVGTVIGVGIAILNATPVEMARELNLAGATPSPAIGLAPIGPFLSQVIGAPFGAIVTCLTVVALLLIFKGILRKDILAFVMTGIVLSLMNVGEGALAIQLPTALVVGAVLVVTCRVAGLLTFGFANFSAYLLTGPPLTLDASRWYFGRSVFLVSIVVAIALYGFRTALGRRPVFSPSLLDD